MRKSWKKVNSSMLFHIRASSSLPESSRYMKPAKCPLSYKPMPMVRRLLKSVWLTMYQPHRAKCSS